MYPLQKLFAAFYSTIVFSIVFGLLSINQGYGFMFYFISVGIYSGIIYLIIGIPISLLIDYCYRRVRRLKRGYRWFILWSLYIVAGMIASSFFWVPNLDFKDLGAGGMVLLWFGIAASLIFMMIDRLIVTVRNVRHRNENALLDDISE